MGFVFLFWSLHFRASAEVQHNFSLSIATCRPLGMENVVNAKGLMRLASDSEALPSTALFARVGLAAAYDGFAIPPLATGERAQISWQPICRRHQSSG